MYIYYVDKRTIGLEPDSNGYNQLQYYTYDESMSWEEIKTLHPEDIIPYLVKVTDPEKMRKLVDPDGKQEMKQRKSLLLNAIDFIYETLTTSDGKLVMTDEYYQHPYTPQPYNSFGGRMNTFEEETYDLQYAEAKAFRDSNYTNIRVCPNVAEVARTANRDLNELVDKIIYKHEKTMIGGLKYLGYKQKNTKFIENQNNLEKVRELGLNYDWIDFGSEFTKSDINAFMNANSDRFRYYDQFPSE